MAKADYYGIYAKYNCGQYYGKHGAQTQASINCEAQVNAEYDRENGCLASYGTSCGAKAAADAAKAKAAADEKQRNADNLAKNAFLLESQKKNADLLAQKKSSSKPSGGLGDLQSKLGIRPQREARSKIGVPKIGIPRAMQAAAIADVKRKRLKMFSADDSDFGNVNDLYGMKRGGVTMASRRGDGAAIKGKTRGGMK